MLENLFTSQVRIDMLKLLLSDAGEEYYVREITRAVGTEINAVRRELKNLESLRLVKKWQRGNRLYYKVVTDHPLYDPLLALISHEAGLGGLIVKHKRKLGNVKYAFIAKALPRGRVAEEGDVDLVLVGDINVEVLKQYIRKAEKEHNHEINYMILSETEFNALKSRKDTFINKVLTMPRIMLLGDEEEMVE
ncbi:MAG: helix-turn-helix domain-containing protein [Patescibacteria group bacterium]|nr:helix-turn-helix domain-containing protein [Patescibacteria group bacterium]